VRRGSRYLDNLDVTLFVDAERAFGWYGATLFACGLYNNGIRFTENWLVRAAILDGVPGDPDRPKHNAIKLGKGDGALAVVELNYLDHSTRAAVGY
jgi:hypothetical protein